MLELKKLMVHLPAFVAGAAVGGIVTWWFLSPSTKQSYGGYSVGEVEGDPRRSFSVVDPIYTSYPTSTSVASGDVYDPYNDDPEDNPHYESNSSASDPEDRNDIMEQESYDEETQFEVPIPGTGEY